MAAMANLKRIAVAFLLAAAVLAASTEAKATTLTLYNLCPYPVWPLVTPNTGFPPVSDNTDRLDGNGGFAPILLPDSFWAGRVAARTGCAASPSLCETGSAAPMTVVQLNVHAWGKQDQTEYSVSLVQGFNVPAVVTPLAVAGGQCPALGCAADLNAGCPWDQRVLGAGGAVVACKGPPEYFKERCPRTLTRPNDVQPVPERCFEPRVLKIVFCQQAMVAAAEPAAVAQRD